MSCEGFAGMTANISSAPGHKNIHQRHLLFKEGCITEMTLFTNELTINQGPERSQYAAGGDARYTFSSSDRRFDPTRDTVQAF
jgi:hypothetical protein